MDVPPSFQAVQPKLLKASLTKKGSYLRARYGTDSLNFAVFYHANKHQLYFHAACIPVIGGPGTVGLPPSVLGVANMPSLQPLKVWQ